ncbi:MAG: FitA-like ribbon-helix-helix domain-containing protein [Solirubrobacterales bacterium]
MAAITIRDLDDAAKERLRVRAAMNGRSMEAEARTLIEDAVSRPFGDMNVAQAFRSMAESVGYLDDLVVPRRELSHRRQIPFSDEWDAEQKRDSD